MGKLFFFIIKNKKSELLKMRTPANVKSKETSAPASEIKLYL